MVFVQHLPTKRPVLPRTRLSFVACLELFGSYRAATEGGHPEVVPLGGSLKPTHIIAKHCNSEIFPPSIFEFVLRLLYTIQPTPLEHLILPIRCLLTFRCLLKLAG